MAAMDQVYSEGGEQQGGEKEGGEQQGGGDMDAMLVESADKSDAAVAPTDDGGQADSDALADLGQSQSDEGTQEEETDQSGGAAG